MQNAERRTQNAERRMMVSGIEGETGTYIIYDKLISYMPDPNPNPNPNPKPRLGLRLVLGLGLGLGLDMYDISLSYIMYLPVSHSIPLTIILRSAFCRSAFCVLQNTPAGFFT